MQNRIRFFQRRKSLARLRTRVRARQNTILFGATTLIIFLLSHFYLNVGTPKKVFASAMSAVANGDWTSSSTWSSGRVPQDYDTLTIPAGKTVNVNVVTQEYVDMKIIVYGTLHFDGGKKIRMCDGLVDLKTGGTLIGDNNGSKIDICSYAVWTGAFIANGPIIFDKTGALPVELVYFKAETENNNVNLQWETASQVNCDYFSVERSPDGINFSSIATIKGKGNSTQTDRYNYLDANALSGISYYRLTEVDFDGTSQTYNTVSVNVKNIFEVTVNPNPVSLGGTATCEIPVSKKDKQVEVTAMDVEGKKIFSRIIENTGNSKNMLSFKTDAFTSSGTFFLIVSGIDYRCVKKIMVQ